MSVIELMDQPYYVIHELYRVVLLEHLAKEEAAKLEREKQEAEERKKNGGRPVPRSPSSIDLPSSPMLGPSSDDLEDLLEEGI